MEPTFVLCRSGSPIPIEYLPAENTLSSRVRLMILYQGRPTTTIAVGDPLTFRLEAQEGYVKPRYYMFNASNLNIRTQKEVHLAASFSEI